MVQLLEYNLTALSEESGIVLFTTNQTLVGELALSLLTKAQSPQTHGDFKASNSQWQRVRLLHEARMLEKTTTGSMNRKFRFVGHVSLFLFGIVLENNHYPILIRSGFVPDLLHLLTPKNRCLDPL